MTELHWTEVDGVTTIWTDTPEPLRASLLFRTGRADETVVTAGQTHLIEHMVLSVINDRNSNGFIDDLVTSFVTMGRPEDVSAFLLRVCKALQSLPADRLETEKKILLTEAASRSHDICGDLLVWRFGAAGHGQRVLPEHGIRGATLERLEAWSAQRFTRGNAVLWLSGPLPDDLRLELPPGEKQPLPPLISMQPEFPSWYINDRCNGIAVGAMVPRVAASTIFNLIASERLHEQLRVKQGVSYAPSIFYEPLNADTAHLVLYADSDPNRRPELAEAFGKIIETLTEIDDAEVDTARKQFLDHTTGSLAPPLSDRLAYEAHSAAMYWLFGKEFESMELITTEAAEVSAADVAVFSREILHTALFAVPGEATIQPWMGKKALISTGTAVKGKEIPSMDAPVQRERLIYSPEGVSIRWPDGTHITVRYSELSAALHYEDGCICLIGSDATHVNVEPTLWRNGPSICREIYERVPAHLLLEQGSRSADAIPKPKTTTWQRFRSLLSQRR